MANKDKPKTPADDKANADNFEFHSDTPTSSGQNANLGDQVQPETMTSEKDGHRTLANPVRDPGPYIPSEGAGSVGARHPDRTKDEVTYADANPEPLMIKRRISTTPDHFTRGGENISDDQTLAPDLYIHGGASQVYNPEKGDGLTDIAVEKAAQGRELAPTVE